MSVRRVKFNEPSKLKISHNGVMKMELNLNQIKAWAVDQVMWAENNMRGKSGKEKREAVIKRLDDMIKLPFYLEWLDDKIIGIFVDLICDKLNNLYAHKFADAKPDVAQLVREIALPEEIAHEQQ